MTEPPESNNDTDVRPGRESTTGTPRWVVAFGIIAVVVVLLLVFVLLAGGGPGGGHGPARH